MSRGKAAGGWRWPPVPSSAEVEERVELYLYQSFGHSWRVVEWNSLLPASTTETWKKHIKLISTSSLLYPNLQAALSPNKWWRRADWHSDTRQYFTQWERDWMKCASFMYKISGLLLLTFGRHTNLAFFICHTLTVKNSSKHFGCQFIPKNKLQLLYCVWMIPDIRHGSVPETVT
jgi:hypothetical protein